MAPQVETLAPYGSPPLIGPYSRVAKVGHNITIGGLGGVDPKTAKIPRADAHAQTVQILKSLDAMLKSVGSDLNHVVHIHVLLGEMRDFDDMNVAYISVMGDHRPARTVIAAKELPKPDFRVLMNLTAVTAD
ncbi:MAG: RidA family protein [Rhodospirillaceae bacterium]